MNKKPKKGKRGRPRRRGRPNKVKRGRPRRRGRPKKIKRGRPKNRKGTLSFKKNIGEMKKKSKKKAEKKKKNKKINLPPVSLKAKKKISPKPKVQKEKTNEPILELNNNFSNEEVFEENEREKGKFQNVFDGVHQTKIRILAVGGGASTIISEIADSVKKSDFWAANTDGRSLNSLPSNIKKFQFGLTTTKGLGTGMNPELGRLAITEDKEKIKDILEGQDLTIIVACLGGGTSSGSTSTFAGVSKSLGNITYGIFTLPFEFEGEKKMEAALAALEEIRPHLDVFTVIPNENIFKIVDKNTPLKDALSAINKRLAENLEGLIETIYFPGLINIDFADLRAILTGKGRVAYLNTVELEGTSAEEINQKLISSPIYPYTIKGAKGILYNITSGRGIQLSEVSQISNIIMENVNKKAKIIFGINQNAKYSDKAKIMILATGCSAKEFFEQKNISDDDGVEKPVKKTAPKKEIKKEEKKEVVVAPKEIKKEKKVEKPKPVIKKKVEKKKPIIKKEKPVEKKIIAKKQTAKKVIVKKEAPKKITPVQKSEAKPVKVEKKSIKPAVKEKPSLPEPKEKAVFAGEKVSEEQKEEKMSVNVVTEKKEAPPVATFTKSVVGSGEFGKIRKNGLQVKREIEEAEKEFLDQEKIWDIPAILRKKKNDSNDV
jgi:cell division protein FtsZ